MSEESKENTSKFDVRQPNYLNEDEYIESDEMWGTICQQYNEFIVFADGKQYHEPGTEYLDIENVKENGQKMLEEYMKISNKTADFDMSDTEINGSVEDQHILDRICTREHTFLDHEG